MELLFFALLWQLSYAVAGVITENGAAAHAGARTGYDRASRATAGMRGSSRPAARGVARGARGLGRFLGALWGTLVGLIRAARDGRERGLRNAPTSWSEVKDRLPWRRPDKDPAPDADTVIDGPAPDNPSTDPPAPGYVRTPDGAPRPIAGDPAPLDLDNLPDLDAIPAPGTPTGGTPMSGTPTGEANGITAARQQLAQFAAAAALYCDRADAAEAQATRDAATAAALVAAADQLEASMRAGGVDGATLAEVAAIKDAAGLKQRAAEAHKTAAVADREAADALSAACRAGTRGLNSRQGGVEDAVKGSAHQVAKTEFLKD